MCAQAEACEGKFRIGDGRLVRPHEVGSIHVECMDGILNIAEVPKDCPPLLSVRSKQQMGLILDFRNQRISEGYRTDRMVLQPSGLPVLGLSEFDDQDQEFDEEFRCQKTFVNSVSDGVAASDAEVGNLGDNDKVVKRGERTGVCVFFRNWPETQTKA